VYSSSASRLHDAARHPGGVPRRRAGESSSDSSYRPGPALASFALTGASTGTLTAGLAVLIGGTIIALSMRASSSAPASTTTLGGVVDRPGVVGGCTLSGHIGHVAEDPNTLQEAFVATKPGDGVVFLVSPLAFTLEYLMLWTDKSKIITYGIASAAGVIAARPLTRSRQKPFAGKAFATRRTRACTSSAAC